MKFKIYLIRRKLLNRMKKSDLGAKQSAAPDIFLTNGKLKEVENDVST